MDQAGDAQDYWFDAGPLLGEPPDEPAETTPSEAAEFRAAWSESRSVKSRLSALRNVDLKAMAGEMWDKFGAPTPIMRFAEANGFDFAWQSYDELPGLIFLDGERRSIFTHRGSPEIEFGNYNTIGRELVQQFGYVAIRHGLDLPHLVLDARANDATPPRGAGLYAKKGSHTSLTENYRGSDSASPMQKLRTPVQPLDLGPGAAQHFTAYCEVGREAEGRTFLNSEPALMTDLTRVFDVEVTPEWIFLYAYAVDVATEEADRWAWIFSVTSQVLDRVQVWGRSQGVTVIEELPGFYTDKRVERPESLAKLPTPSPGWNAFWSDSLWG